MKNVIIILSVFILLPGSIEAQDMHYSQFFRNPVYLNPALTGWSGSQYRFGYNYRNQWNSVNSPYITNLVYVDKNFDYKRRFMMKQGGYAGVGLAFLDDMAGAGTLRTNKLMLTAATHITLSKRLSGHVGIGGGFTNKRADYSKLNFYDQWSYSTNSFSEPGNEANYNEALFHPDISFGFVVNYYYKHAGKSKSYHIGLSNYYSNQPVESFYQLTNKSFKQGRKTIIHFGMIYSNSSFQINTRAYLSLQKAEEEYLVNLDFNYMNFYFGFISRIGNKGMRDIVPMFGYNISNIGLAIIYSYDVNISGFRYASHFRGGSEITISYHLKKKHRGKKRKHDALDCPDIVSGMLFE